MTIAPTLPIVVDRAAPTPRASPTPETDWLSEQHGADARLENTETQKSRTVQVEPSPVCTAERWNTEVWNCVKPTMPPPSTPRPTPTTPIEIPLPPTEVGPTPTPIPPLTERIKATLDSNRYDAIARVKVISNERVTIIPYEKIFVADWTRSTLEPVYYL